MGYSTGFRMELNHGVDHGVKNLHGVPKSGGLGMEPNRV